MTRNRRKVLAAAAGATGCALSAQLFVMPCSQGRPLQQVATAAPPAQATAVSSSSSSSVLPMVGLSAACALLMANDSSRAKKVGRNFFDFGGSGGSSYRSFDPATEAGVQDPVGFWDPLGFSSDKDEATFKRRRSVEIKHGRISMYATIGYIVPEYYKFPGSLSPSQGIKFSDVPNGLAAFSKVPFFGWLQIFAFAGLIETSGFFSGKATAIGFQKDSTVDGEPGNYGVGFPNFIGKVTDREARATKLNAELANGRLAMVAIIGMLFQDGLTGAAWGDWALYTASPLRAASDTDTRVAAEAAPVDDSEIVVIDGKKYRKKKVKKSELTPEQLATAVPVKEPDLTTGRSNVKVPVVKAEKKGDGLPLAIPFLPPPFYRSFAANVEGDSGFDPLNVAQSYEILQGMKEAEIKHGRLAMMAAVGWPASELIAPRLAKALGGIDTLADNGKAPSFLNGGLGEPTTFFAVLLGGAVMSFAEWIRGDNSEAGNLGFDPLKLGKTEIADIFTRNIPPRREYIAEAEIKHGRTAMMVIVFCVVYELIFDRAVIKLIPREARNAFLDSIGLTA